MTAIPEGLAERAIENLIMQAVDIMAGTLKKPADPRCWDHLLIYCPRDAIERRHATLSTHPSVYRVSALSTSSLNPSSLNQSDQS